jgi:hypothetical protein
MKQLADVRRKGDIPMKSKLKAFIDTQTRKNIYREKTSYLKSIRVCRQW